MPVIILIPTALRSYADGNNQVTTNAATVQEALDQLTAQYEKLRHHLYNEEGQLRNFVNIYLNDDDIRYLQRGETALQDGDELTIVPAVAGGKFESIITEEPATLSKEEMERYSRHLIMPEFGVAGQRKLKNARVLIIGTGGLGSPLALYLAAAGIGKLGLVDFDTVDFTNLQRQVIHHTADVGRPKLESAAEKIRALNPHVDIELHHTPIQADNAFGLIEPYDLVIDGTDNFQTRYLVNDACVLLGKPNVYGSIFRFEGQASVFWAEKGPCYRCLYPEPPPPGLVPSCAEGGVLGILPGIIGIIQATEAIKLIIGEGDSLVGRLLLFDALGMTFKQMKLRKDPDCPLCGQHPTLTELIDYDQFCGITQQKEPAMPDVDKIDALSLKQEMDQGQALILLDVREPHEIDICTITSSLNIPLGELESRVNELNPAEDLVVYCRSGMRSAKAVAFLREAGYARTRNLTGGILAWADQVDHTLAKY